MGARESHPHLYSNVTFWGQLHHVLKTMASSHAFVRRKTMKLGIIQMEMHWTLDENVTTIAHYMSQYHELDALVFPELSICGFHRNVHAESQPKRVNEAIEHLCHLAQKHQITVFVGAPVTKSDKVYNQYLCISEQGNVSAQWDKIGLTPSESTFFTKGEKRNTVNIKGINTNALICREAEDVDWYISTVQNTNPDLVLWPSYIGQSPQKIEARSYYTGAPHIANQLNAFVVQCNWPHALNDTSLRGLGGSNIYDTNGECIATMPFDEVSVGVLDTTTAEFTVLETKEIATV